MTSLSRTSNQVVPITDLPLVIPWLLGRTRGGFDYSLVLTACASGKAANANDAVVSRIAMCRGWCLISGSKRCLEVGASTLPHNLREGG